MAFGEIDRRRENTQCDFASRRGDELVVEGRQVAGDQCEKVRGLRIRVVPDRVVPARVTRDSASLADNFKNTYKRITFGIFDKPVGRIDTESLYP